MLYTNMKLWTPVENLIIPKSGINGRNVCIFFFGENNTFFDVYNRLNIERNYIRYYYVPTITMPIKTWLTPSLNIMARLHKLLPRKSLLGDYTDLEGNNFYFDSSVYFSTIDQRLKIKRYNEKRAYKVYTQFINSLDGVDSTKFEKTILYSVNLDNPFSENILYRKFINIFLMLYEAYKEKDYNILPFDKLLLFVYNKESATYIKLFDKNLDNNNITRIRSIISNLKTTDESHKENTIEIIQNEIQQQNEDINLPEEFQKQTNTAINNFLKTSTQKEIQDVHQNTITPENIDDIKTKSIIYNSLGNITKTHSISRRLSVLSPEKKKEIMDLYTKNILPRDKSISSARNPILKIAKIDTFLKSNPSHILNKRKNDFQFQLTDDIKEAFNTLSTKDYPLQVSNMNIKTITTGDSEIMKSIKQRYQIELTDRDGNIHNVEIDLPKINEDGTFTINGLRSIIANQLIRFPLFFPGEDTGRFESSFSTMKILSKRLRVGSYFIGFLGSYKLPLVEILAYKQGLKKVMNDYGVTYRIEE